jgi:hypothetical protein
LFFFLSLFFLLSFCYLSLFSLFSFFFFHFFLLIFLLTQSITLYPGGIWSQDTYLSSQRWYSYTTQFGHWVNPRLSKSLFLLVSSAIRGILLFPGTEFSVGTQQLHT